MDPHRNIVPAPIFFPVETGLGVTNAESAGYEATRVN